MTAPTRAHRALRCALVACLAVLASFSSAAPAAFAIDEAGITAGTTDDVKTATILGNEWEKLATEPVFTSRGGWVGGNKFVTNPASRLGIVEPDVDVLSETYLISEPGRLYSGAITFETRIHGSRVDTDGAGGIQPARWTAFEAVTYCRYGDLITSPVYKTYMGWIGWDARSRTREIGTLEHAVNGCGTRNGVAPRLVAIELYAHTLVQANNPINAVSGQLLSNSNPSRANPNYPSDNFLVPGYTVLETSRHVWYAGLNHSYAPYDSDLPDYGDGNPGVGCAVNPNAAECDVLDRWKPYDDATDFDKVCSGAPAAEWLSFGWLPEWIGHYTSCLFKPKAGFPSDPVMYELEQSTVGTVTTQIKSVATALPQAESCGVLFTSNALGSPMSLDTCSWGDWSSAKTWIGYAAIVLAGLNGLNMLLGTIMSRSMRPDGD